MSFETKMLVMGVVTVFYVIGMAVVIYMFLKMKASEHVTFKNWFPWLRRWPKWLKKKK